jgi:hypothetical protein
MRLWGSVGFLLQGFCFVETHLYLRCNIGFCYDWLDLIICYGWNVREVLLFFLVMLVSLKQFERPVNFNNLKYL